MFYTVVITLNFRNIIREASEVLDAFNYSNLHDNVTM